MSALGRRDAQVGQPSGWVERGLLACLLVLALLVRLWQVGAPPLDSAVGRQYHSMFIARVFYLESLPETPAWRLRLARAEAPRLIEPPVVELAAAGFYRLTGGESPWFPRLLSIAAWLSGAVFLYLIARRLALGWGSFAAVAIFLFLPAAIQLSRNFQPEPLMIALMVASIWALLRYDESPSWGNLLIAAGLGSAAVFVKPLAVFCIASIFVILSARRLGVLGMLRSLHSYVLAGILVLPGGLWTAHGFLGAGFLVGQEDGRIEPGLVFTPFFWVGLVRSLGAVVTPAIAVLGIAGYLLLRRGGRADLLSGWIAGYVLLAFTFSYHTATHHYYNLQAVPLAALAAAPVAQRLILHPSWRPLAIAALIVGILAGGLLGLQQISLSSTQWRQPSLAAEIGRHVRHSGSTLAVVDRPIPPRWLFYHGEFGGMWWLAGETLEARGLDPPYLQAEHALERILSLRRRYLVVVDRARIDAVEGLWDRLRERFATIAEAPDYVILDLRE